MNEHWSEQERLFLMAATASLGDIIAAMRELLDERRRDEADLAADLAELVEAFEERRRMSRPSEPILPDNVRATLRQRVAADPNLRVLVRSLD